MSLGTHQVSFILCAAVFCLRACMYTSVVPNAQGGPGRALDPSELELEGYELPLGAGNPLQKQVLLTVEPSLKLQRLSLQGHWLLIFFRCKFRSIQERRAG